MEDSGIFRTNHSASHRQGWAFRDFTERSCLITRKKKVTRRIAKIKDIL